MSYRCRPDSGSRRDGGRRPRLSYVLARSRVKDFVFPNSADEIGWLATSNLAVRDHALVDPAIPRRAVVRSRYPSPLPSAYATDKSDRSGLLRGGECLMVRRPTRIEESSSGHAIAVYAFADGRLLLFSTQRRHRDTLCGRPVYPRNGQQDLPSMNACSTPKCRHSSSF